MRNRKRAETYGVKPGDLAQIKSFWSADPVAIQNDSSKLRERSSRIRMIESSSGTVVIVGATLISTGLVSLPVSGVVASFIPSILLTGGAVGYFDSARRGFRSKRIERATERRVDELTLEKTLGRSSTDSIANVRAQVRETYRAGMSKVRSWGAAVTGALTVVALVTGVGSLKEFVQGGQILASQLALPGGALAASAAIGTAVVAVGTVSARRQRAAGREMIVAKEQELRHEVDRSVARDVELSEASTGPLYQVSELETYSQLVERGPTPLPERPVVPDLFPGTVSLQSDNDGLTI